MQLSFLTPPAPPQARVYGTLAPKDRRRVQRMATSVKARVMAYFRAHPDARITAPQLGEILNLRVENCLAPRMSELAGEGWLQRTTELTDGARGCSVHRYSVGPFFDGGESK